MSEARQRHRDGGRQIRHARLADLPNRSSDVDTLQEPPHEPGRNDRTERGAKAGTSSRHHSRRPRWMETVGPAVTPSLAEKLREKREVQSQLVPCAKGLDVRGARLPFGGKDQGVHAPLRELIDVVVDAAATT